MTLTLYDILLVPMEVANISIFEEDFQRPNNPTCIIFKLAK